MIIRLSALSMTVVLLFAGCASNQKPELKWTASKIRTVTGFRTPECVVVDDANDRTYVSNVDAAKDEYWSDDGKGFISLLHADGGVRKYRWAATSVGTPLHGPKGMCLLGGYLYFNDNTRLMRCSADGGDRIEVVAEGFKKANDLATDGHNVWVTDTAAGKVYSVTPRGEKRAILAPESINGITFHLGRLYGVSWDLHDLYELDPHGVVPPKPFGLAKHFTNLDGIEVLADGTFLVSDFMGGAVYTVSPNRKDVMLLAKLDSPADIGLGSNGALLYVPQFFENHVVIYSLAKKR
ncbi:MAG: hypothetical protein KAI66_09645 [Lentisphaeria bacterium]|nr:hypothetical protein [Lentisphaeria bacterium]